MSTSEGRGPSQVSRDRARRDVTRRLYRVGDYLAGVTTGIAAAVLIHAVVTPGWDMVLASSLGSRASKRSRRTSANRDVMWSES